MNRLPLESVRVLDLTTTLAGPSATRLMADFGAEVIKVESSLHPDTSRLGSPFLNETPGMDRSGYFSAYNAGKLSFALNLRRPESRDVMRRLVAVSDVLVESFAPGVMNRLGLSIEVLREWNPRLIIASHSLQGQSGPRSSQRGYGQLASALTGWFELTGEDGLPAVGPYSAYTDFIAWPLLLSSILIALEERDCNGTISTIDHSHIESSAYFAAPELLAAQTGAPPRRHGNSETYAVPSGTFLCADGAWCALTVENDAQWEALGSALGQPPALIEERFSTLTGRRQWEAAVTNEVAKLFRGWEAEELVSALLEQGVPASRVLDAEGLFNDEQIRFRSAFRRLDHPVLGDHAVVAPAFAIGSLPAGPHRSFPMMGEHTEAICRDLLGLDPDEIAALAASGIFE